MALLWIEGFESFGTTNGNNPVGLQAKYDNCNADSNFTIQAGRVAGKSMRFPSTGSGLMGKTVSPSGASTLIVGFGFFQDAFTASNIVFRFWDGASVQGALEMRTDGTFKYYRGNGSTLLGTTSGSISASTWTYVEIKVTFHGSTGTVDIWFDGSNVLSLTGQNTSQSGNAFATGVMWQWSPFSADHTTYDDIYVLDGTGSINNARLGARIIKMIVPASDAGTNQFTPDSGSNHYDRLTENPQDTTSYLEDDTTGHRELFGMGVLQLATVAGLQMNVVGKVTDNTVYSLKNSIHTGGGTDSDDAAQSMADANYQTLSRVVETNPETSALWTPFQINSAQFGFKVG